MICAFICLSLLTMIAAMHLIAKSNKENSGSFFKWTSYFILVVATCTLVCQIFCCFNRCFLHGGNCSGKEQCFGKMHGDDLNCSKEIIKCERREMKCDGEEKCHGDNKCHDEMKCDKKEKCSHELMGKDSACCKDKKVE